MSDEILPRLERRRDREFVDPVGGDERVGGPDAVGHAGLGDFCPYGAVRESGWVECGGGRWGRREGRDGTNLVPGDHLVMSEGAAAM